MHHRPYPLTRSAAVLLLAPALLAGGCGAARLPARPSEIAYPPLRFSIPEAERIVLDCGAPLYLLRDARLPLFSFYAMARAGSAFDPEGKEGLAALVAEVMRTGGSAGADADEVDRRLEYVGANLSVDADHDATALSLSCLSRDTSEALGIALDLLLRPAFSQKKIDLRKEQVREAIRRWNDEPGQVAAREFRRLVYGAHPYAHPVVGEPGSMDSIGRNDLVAFHRARCNPSGMIFGAAGDFDRDTLLKVLNAAFGAERSSPPPPPPPVEGRDERRVFLIRRPTEQAHLLVGHAGIARNDPDLFPVMLLNEILGGGVFSSRILERIRSAEGLAYSAGSRLTPAVRAGLFYASCQTKESSAARALDLLMEEMERIRRESVTEEELRRAKDSYTNSFVFNFTSPSKVVEQMVGIEFAGLPRDYLNLPREGRGGDTGGCAPCGAEAPAPRLRDDPRPRRGRGPLRRPRSVRGGEHADAARRRRPCRGADPDAHAFARPLGPVGTMGHGTRAHPLHAPSPPPDVLDLRGDG